MYGCCFRYASAVILCVWCARRGRQQWCVNKSSKFNFSSQVELPSATAGTHTHTHTGRKLQPNQPEKQAHTFTSDTLYTFSINTEMHTLYPVENIISLTKCVREVYCSGNQFLIHIPPMVNSMQGFHLKRCLPSIFGCVWDHFYKMNDCIKTHLYGVIVCYWHTVLIYTQK